MYKQSKCHLFRLNTYDRNYSLWGLVATRIAELLYSFRSDGSYQPVDHDLWIIIAMNDPEGHFIN